MERRAKKPNKHKEKNPRKNRERRAKKNPTSKEKNPTMHLDMEKKSKEKPSNAWSERKIKFAQVYWLDSSSSLVRSFFFLLLLHFVLHSLFTHSSSLLHSLFTPSFFHSLVFTLLPSALWKSSLKDLSST